MTARRDTENPEAIKALESLGSVASALADAQSTVAVKMDERDALIERCRDLGVTRRQIAESAGIGEDAVRKVLRLRRQRSTA